MNWTILYGLADESGDFQDALTRLRVSIESGWPLAARAWAIEAASIAHALMDRADDLEALEREEYEEMHPPEEYA